MLLLVFLTLGLVVGSHGALSPELYWKSVLPNTVMPKDIRGFKELQTISITEVKTSKWMEKIGLDSNGDYVSYKPPSAAATQNPNHISTYFLEKDIHTGSLMTLDFTTTNNPSNNGPSFLPRKVSDSIPFSSSQFPQILTRFAIKPESKEAKVMKDTIAGCERPAMKGEEKYCATSLESMVDFIASKVGNKNVAAISTEGKVDRVQEYRIVNGLVKMNNKNVGGSSDDNKVVVCHEEKYPYGVFYCHALVRTNAYVVPLVGSDGKKVNAVAVCHTDTSEWTPNHLAFEVLKVKPGTSSICHFLGSQQFMCV